MKTFCPARTIKIIRASAQILTRGSEREKLVSGDVTGPVTAKGARELKAAYRATLAPLGTNLNSRRPLSSHLGKRVIKRRRRDGLPSRISSISQSNEAGILQFLCSLITHTYTPVVSAVAAVVAGVPTPRRRCGPHSLTLSQSSADMKKPSYFFVSRIGMRQKEKQRQSIHVRKVNTSCLLTRRGRIRFERRRHGCLLRAPVLSN
jgi:hypothetical protein